MEPHYNEVLGTIKITLLYQVSHYIRVKKQRNIKSWDQQNYLVITGFCYIRPLYNEVPLYTVWKTWIYEGGRTFQRCFSLLLFQVILSTTAILQLKSEHPHLPWGSTRQIFSPTSLATANQKWRSLTEKKLLPCHDDIVYPFSHHKLLKKVRKLLFIDHISFLMLYSQCYNVCYMKASLYVFTISHL